jgi:hypothetical protein
MMNNILTSKHWIRLFFMLIFAGILYFATIILCVVVVIQFLVTLATGSESIELRKFGSSLSEFFFQSLKFLTYSSEEKPFPFSDWPSASDVDDDQ